MEESQCTFAKVVEKLENAASVKHVQYTDCLKTIHMVPRNPDVYNDVRKRLLDLGVVTVSTAATVKQGWAKIERKTAAQVRWQ